MFSNDILNIHIILSSIMDVIWMESYNEKDVILPITMSNAPLIYDYNLFHIGFEIYYYS
jgi:hypothetical protein